MHRESRNTVRLLPSVDGSRVYKDDKKWKDEKKERGDILATIEFCL